MSVPSRPIPPAGGAGDAAAPGPDVPGPPPGRRLADVPTSGPVAVRPIAGPPVGVRERRERNVGWRSRDVARAAVMVLAIYVLGQLLWFANALVFVVFLGTLFGLAVGAGVDRLERFKIRRGIASALLVFGSLGSLVGAGVLMAPTLTEQFGVLRQQIPQAVDRFEGWVATHPNSLVATAVRAMGNGGDSAQAAPAAGGAAAGAAAGAAGGGATGAAGATPNGGAGTGSECLRVKCHG